MNKTHLLNVMRVFASLTVLCLAAIPAGADPPQWRPLLQDHSAPAWRRWKAPGLPAGWHIAGGVPSKEGSGDDLVTMSCDPSITGTKRGSSFGDCRAIIAEHWPFAACAYASYNRRRNVHPAG